MKRSNLFMVGVVAMTLAIAPAVRAQDNLSTTTTTTTTPANLTVTGVVVSTAGDEIIITTDAGQRMVFMRDPIFTMPTGLAPGNRVTVTYGGTADNYTVNHIVMADNTVTTTTTTTTDNPPPATSTYSTTTTTVDSDLPSTAGPVPFLGLLGALTLGAGAAVRALRNRR